MTVIALLSTTQYKIGEESNLMLLRAMSIAFCRLGSPAGIILCRSEMAFSTS